jgi:hypothetical protein
MVLPSWAVDVAASSEVMVTNRDLPPEALRVSPMPRTNRLAFLGRSVVLGEPLLAYLSGDRAPKPLAAEVGRKTTAKGRKTLATTHVDKVQWHGWTQQAIRQKPNKNAQCLRIPAQSPFIDQLNRLCGSVQLDLQWPCRTSCPVQSIHRLRNLIVHTLCL